ncbi:hypothetical protein CBM2637_A200168 [Cupriavidus taiwanensis]|nr:hypothetical protein CBM2637_A200168 [Cupriavidus taiwanensis]
MTPRWEARPQWHLAGQSEAHPKPTYKETLHTCRPP